MITGNLNTFILLRTHNVRSKIISQKQKLLIQESLNTDTQTHIKSITNQSFTRERLHSRIVNLELDKQKRIQ